jgi:uncharacterized YigZ family protein
MQDFRIVPARRIQTEFIEKNSRFITSAAPAFTVEQAQTFIHHIGEKYPDATHHVPIFLIGHGASVVEHCSDDGEPSGTAGKPALAVLRGSGLGDIVVVITRYFGGTKLGTGGLVRAYSDSMRKVLTEMPRAKKLATTTLLFVVPYSLFERAQIIIANFDGFCIEKNFAADVTISVRLPNQHLDDFKERMIGLTQGGIEFITIETRDNTIIPIKSKRL